MSTTELAAQKLTLHNDGEMENLTSNLGLPSQEETYQACSIENEVSQGMLNLIETIKDIQTQRGGKPLFVSIPQKLGSDEKSLIYILPKIDISGQRTGMESDIYMRGNVTFLLITTSGFWAIRFQETYLTQEFIESLKDPDWSKDLDSIKNPTLLSNLAINLRWLSQGQTTNLRITHQDTSLGDMPIVEFIAFEFRLPFLRWITRHVSEQITCEPNEQADAQIERINEDGAEFVLETLLNFNKRLKIRDDTKKSTLALLEQGYTILTEKQKNE